MGKSKSIPSLAAMMEDGCGFWQWSVKYWLFPWKKSRSLLRASSLIQLLEEKYAIVTARDGASGVAAASHEKPDLILMDIPVLDGWEATRRIKLDDELANIPIIGLSSRAMHGDAEKAILAGCDDYLTKPFDENELYQKLEYFLEK